MTLTGQNSINSDLKTAERNVQLLQKASDAIVPALNSVGDALLGLSDRSYRAFADVQRGLTNLGNITGSTTEEMAAYHKELGFVIERTGGQIAENDLLAASYDAASAGFTDTADAMAVMESAARLAIAGNSGLTDATDNMASSQKAVVAGLKSYSGELSAYGSTADQAAVITEKMYKVIQLGITDIKQLAPEFAEIAPSAAAAGLSMDELSASYATLTSAGIKTTLATTQLKALISSIARGGATEDSKKMIEELGLAFDATSLQTEGLSGILESLASKGVNTFEQYLKLTGSTEAATGLAALAAQNFGEKLDHVKNGVVDIDELLENLSGDPLGKLTTATNAFNRALADAGGSMAPIEATMLGFATNVLDAFNALPEPFKNAIGAVAVGTGVLAKGTAGIVDLATKVVVARIAYVQFRVQVKKAIAAQVASTKATGAQALANKGLTASLLKLNLALKAKVGLMGTVAVGAAAFVAATASIGMAYQQYQNIQTQFKEQEKLSNLMQTDQLASKATGLAIRMRETGEALPDEEFRQWIGLLEQANVDNGTLTSIIEGLTRVQHKAKQGLLETTDAMDKANLSTEEKALQDALNAAGLGDLTDAYKDNQKATEDAAKAAEDAAEKQAELEAANRAVMESLANGLTLAQNALGDFNSQLNNDVEAGTLTTQESFSKRIQALELYAHGIKASYAIALQSETLSTEQANELRNTQTRELQKNKFEQLKIQRDYAAELRKINDEQNKLEMLALETKAANEKWTAYETQQAIRQLKNEQLKATIATIEAELNAVKQGSQKQRQLVLELYGAKAELSKNVREFADAEIAESERVAKEVKRKAEETKRARIENWEKETQAYVSQLNFQVQAFTNANNRIQQALDARASMNSLKLGELGNFEGGVSTRDSARERALEIETQIAKLQKEQRETGESKAAEIAKLNSQLSEQRNIVNLTSKELAGSAKLLSEMGVKVSANLTGEKAALAVAQVKLNLENEQIALKLQQETISIRLKQLEQDRLILELQRLAASEDATETEKRNLALQIANAQEAKKLLSESLALTTKQAKLQQSSNVSGARLDLAAKGIDPGSLGAELGRANQELSKEVDQSFSRNIKEVVASQDSSSKAILGGQTSQTQALGASLQTLGQGVAGAINPLGNTMANVDRNIVQGLGAGVAATQAQTTELRAQLQALQQATNALPGRIAALMPRPAPTARN